MCSKICCSVLTHIFLWLLHSLNLPPPYRSCIPFIPHLCLFFVDLISCPVYSVLIYFLDFNWVLIWRPLSFSSGKILCDPSFPSFPYLPGFPDSSAGKESAFLPLSLSLSFSLFLSTLFSAIILVLSSFFTLGTPRGWKLELLHLFFNI